MVEPTEELLTAEEAADRLGVTRSYLYRLIKRGVLPEAVGIRNGREVKLIPAAALERLNAHEGLLVRDVGEPEGRPADDRPVTEERSTTGQSPDTGAYTLLLTELRAELRALRGQLAEERAARQELEAQLDKRPPEQTEDVATVISRANEVTALVKASELKHDRILEALIAQKQWGRAPRIAYAVYLAVTTAVAIAALILIFRMAAQFEVFLTK